MSTLFQAASKGNLEVLKDILRHASDNKCDISDQKNVALLAAAMYGHDRISDVLIKNGADVNNCNDDDRHTALHWATYRGHSRVVEILLASGAEVDQQDKDGNTALMFASSKGFEHIVRILLDFKASTRAFNKLNETAIHVACLGSDNATIVQFLIKFGSYVNQPGRHGWTPLHYCAEYERVNSARALLKAGSNPVLVDNIYDTPLDIVEDKDIYGEEIHAILLEATQNWIAASDAKHQSSTSENRKDGRSTPLETERARRRAERERLDYGARQQEQQKQQPNKDNDEHDWFADKPSI